MPEEPPEPQQVPNYAPPPAETGPWVLLAGVAVILAAGIAGAIPEPAPLVGTLMLAGLISGTVLAAAGLVLCVRERR